MSLKPSGKTALATGSTRGIDRGIATFLVRQGTTVAVRERDPGRTESVAAERSSLIGGAHVAVGSVNILENNVGPCRALDWLETTSEQWQWTYSTSVVYVRMSQASSLPK